MQQMIAILADGLGYHYLNNNLIGKSFKRNFQTTIPMRSILGYSAGILPSIWTSSYPEDHGNWAEWMIKSDYSPQPVKINYLKWIATCLTFYSVKRIQQILGKVSSLKPSIPGPIKKVFLDKSIDVSRPFVSKNPPSFFTILDENEVSYYYSFCPKIEDINLPSNNSYELLVFYLGEFDGLGHTYGPNSSVTINRILDFLDTIKVLKKKCKLLCVFSDHGMFPVKARVNLLAKLEKLKLNLGTDYLVFLDATMARFWFFSDKAEKKVIPTLSQLSSGKILNCDELKTNGLNFKTDSYGEKIFLFKPSIEVYPNFFHPIYKNWFKGLHGYEPSAKNSYGLFATTFILKSKRGSLLDISPSILKRLEISSAKEWKGKSLC